MIINLWLSAKKEQFFHQDYCDQISQFGRATRKFEYWYSTSLGIIIREKCVETQ